MTRKLITLAIASLITTTFAFAQSPLEQASRLFNEGDYAQAAPLLRQLRQDDAKNNRVAYMLGVVELREGDYNFGKELILQAIKGGVTDASMVMADVRLKEYDLENARTNIDRYRKNAKSNDITRANIDDLEARYNRTSQMLERVERIVILDSIIVDSDKFFDAYLLSKSSGSIRPMSALPKGLKGSTSGTIYTSEDGNTMIWASPMSDDDDTNQLVTSHRLTDGTWETPVPLSEGFGEGGDTNYPFLLTDGSTIYFANDGENSLGGYDIFISRDNGSGYLQPQNIGMPYNSPYDDYMLAIDEERSLGWWATDRNRIPGKVTIYVFRPSDTRQNYDPDTANLTDLAKVTSVRDTWGDNDYSGALSALADASSDNASQRKPRFAISIPGRGVYSELSDFKVASAREAMTRYLETVKALDDLSARLSTLRDQYSHGDKSVSSMILDLEQRIAAQRDNLTKARNEVVRLETRN